MEAVRISGKQQAEIIEQPTPHTRGEFAVVKIEAAPMCTEYKMYRDGNVCESIGHEAAGEVVEAEPGAKVRVGDRVVVMPQYPCGKCTLCMAGDYIHCQNTADVGAATGAPHAVGTYAQYVVKEDWVLLPIPDDLSYDHAAMACCGLGPTLNATRELDIDAFDTVLITGMGPVGLGGVINARACGARVIAVESHPYRARLALELGADAVVNPNDENPLERVLDLTYGEGPSKAIDCSGVASAQRLLIDAVRRRGRVGFVGEAGELTVQVSNDLIRKGISLHGVWHWNLCDAARMIDLIRRSRDLLDRLITHTFPMRDVQEAFDLQLTGECGKVILHPWK